MSRASFYSVVFLIASLFSSQAFCNHASSNGAEGFGTRHELATAANKDDVTFSRSLVAVSKDTMNSFSNFAMGYPSFGNYPSQLPSYGGGYYPSQLPSYGGGYPSQLPSYGGGYPSQLPSYGGGYGYGYPCNPCGSYSSCYPCYNYCSCYQPYPCYNWGCTLPCQSPCNYGCGYGSNPCYSNYGCGSGAIVSISIGYGNGCGNGSGCY